MEYTYHHFTVPLAQVDAVRAWAMDLNNQAQLLENQLGEEVSYTVAIHDVEGVTNKASEFGQLFNLEACVE